MQSHTRLMGGQVLTSSCPSRVQMGSCLQNMTSKEGKQRVPVSAAHSHAPCSCFHQSQTVISQWEQPRMNTPQRKTTPQGLQDRMPTCCPCSCSSPIHATNLQCLQLWDSASVPLPLGCHHPAKQLTEEQRQPHGWQLLLCLSAGKGLQNAFR